MAYIIETRQPETEDRSATEWTRDGMGFDLARGDGEFATREAAGRIVAALKNVGPDWAAAEYRVREVRGAA